ncbi:Tyrosyl-tRNA synthetase [Wickerhamomyces ciferrii]|uniref:Tyrosine--tRNA ligase n=1 Tax=Wickerhamomyces ciferrii (strain ATCC 14091 / BCRC 22168 / CBS 111 / JCM 3599 / NBRC 0793 / NRRL Y-1031 F-60-10) TaxID=1206466 RepID=K0KZX5_WICCF|nr:Tyrosyl-tRNA synthetase [Wickerhamomyces ciferrii]CCH46698.1 Tyrosyl-tRNA synthetase [Wickerhamomyces ciferrii]
MLLSKGNSLRLLSQTLSSQSRRFTQLSTTSFNIDQNELQKDLEEPLIQHLTKRGLISQTSNPEDLENLLNKTKLGLYCGADPTAKSLHLGNLLPLIILLHFNLRGHNIIGLVGGATGAVGDPSGRTTERSMMEDQTRLDNVTKIQNQLEGFFTNGIRYAKYLSTSHVIEEGLIKSKNNFEWWENVSFLGFLSTYGRHIRVAQMLARDSVKGRLESENGIGFNEFTYQILQAFDFWHLFRNEQVSIQVGGNDQWGNITAGIDLINRLKTNLNKKDSLKNRSSFGITAPLLTTASGEKFGKSAGNAVFIDSKITPSFDLYQYFIKTPDSEVSKLLKIFTLLPLKQIEEIISKHEQDPSLRYAQRILSNEVTDLIHGVGSGKSAAIISSILYPLPDQPYPDIGSDELIDAFENANVLKTLPKEEFLNKPFSFILSKVQEISKNESRKLISSGGVYQGFDRIRIDTSDSMLLGEDQLIDGKVLLLRVGKGKYHVIQLV